MTDQLSPAQTVRLLRAKVGELEARVRDAAQYHGGMRPIDEVDADIALIAGLLADLIERLELNTAQAKREAAFREGIDEAREASTDEPLFDAQGRSWAERRDRSELGPGVE